MTFPRVFNGGSAYTVDGPPVPGPTIPVVRWAANTTYPQGFQVVAPTGQIVQANNAFTSGSSYNSANWTVVNDIGAGGGGGGTGNVTDLTDTPSSSATPQAVIGQTIQATAAGAVVTGPAVPGTVGTPPARWGVRNLSGGAITVSFLSNSGSTVTPTLLNGEARYYRQTSTSGWSLETGIPLAQQDARYDAAGAASAAQNAAQTYADAQSVNGKTGHSITLASTDVGATAAGRAPFYNRVNAYTRKFSKALTKTRLGLSDTRILCVGPSTTQGIGSGTNTTVPQWRAWPALLATEFTAGYGLAANGIGLPKSSSSAQPNEDTRWTAGTGWARGTGSTAYIGAGNKLMYYQATGVTSGNLVYADPTILADRFDVYYVANNTGGTFTATATGGTASTVNTAAAGTKTLGKVTVAAASAATTNNVSFAGTVASKSVTIIGVEPWLSTTPKIRLANLGSSGSTSTDWVTENNPGVTLWGGVSFIKVYAPDLTIIDTALGINDIGNGIGTSTTITNLQALVAAGQASGDVMLKSMLPSTSAATNNGVTGLPAKEAALNAAITAAFPNIPIIDTFTGLGGNSDGYASTGDMASDGLHGSDAIYGDEAAMLMSFFATL